MVAIAILYKTTGTAFTTDDWYQMSVLENSLPYPPDTHSLFGLFSFYDGNPDRMRAMIETAGLPWWTDPELLISFFRPLSEATHWLDHKLWPANGYWIHWHSILWYLLLISAVWLMARRIQGANWITGLGLLIYTVDAGHIAATGWIANRNALIATFLGSLVIYFYHRLQSEQWQPGKYLAPLFMILALLAGEAALATFLFLFAYAITIKQGSLLQRIYSLIPYIAIGFIWLIAYYQLGFGTSHSGFYADPGNDALGALQQIAQRWPIAMLSQLSGIPVHFFSKNISPTEIFMITIAVIGLLLIYYPVIKNSSTARFWFISIALSLVLVCTTGLFDRLFIFSSIGTSLLIAETIAYYLQKKAFNKKIMQLTGYALSLWLLVATLIIDPVFSSFFVHKNAARIQPPKAHLTQALEQRDIEKTNVVLLKAGASMSSIRYMLKNTYQGNPTPKAIWSLGFADSELRVTRTDANTLTVATANGFANPNKPLYSVFRSHNYPFTVGDTLEFPDLSIRILEVDQYKMPKTASFHFKEPIESEEFIFLAWIDKTYKAITLPTIGESISL